MKKLVFFLLLFLSMGFHSYGQKPDTIISSKPDFVNDLGISLEMGYGWKINKEGFNAFKLNLIAGVSLNESFFLGVGSGFRYYTQPDYFDFAIPFLVNFRYNILKKEFTPFIALSGGPAYWGTGGIDKVDGIGGLVNLSGGIKFKFTTNTDAYLGVGYDFEKARGSTQCISINFGCTL